jgi:C4-type Zn-finger protein
MKKISSKIIVFLFFFTLLWSGVGTFGIHAANAWDWEGIILGFVGFPIQLIFVPVLGLLVRLAGLLLDMSVQFTLNSSMLGGGVDTAISTTWAIIRNIFNITFIFVLLYTAIKTIIGSAGLDTKKTIANVIIAALLINFSLFITRVVFDAGNILATVLYNQIIPADSAATFGIGSVLMAKIGMSEIFQWKQLGDSTGGMWTVPFFVASCLQVITLLVLLVSFLYAMLLMVTRTVVIIFLMVLSPVGFMGNILPRISEYSKMWRENLYGQVMVAPIFLLFIYLITLIGKGVTDNLATIKTAAVVNGADDPQQYMIFFKFTLIIVLVIAAVKITKKLSGVVGQAVEGFAKIAAGAAIGVATGGVALAGRQLIGRASANALAGDKGADLRARAASGDKRARLALAYHEKASTSSFDVRNTKAAALTGAALGSVGSKLGVAVPGAGKVGTLANMAGVGGTVAEARKAQQEAENKKYNELNASVTNEQRLAANTARGKRDTLVADELEGTIDPATGLRAAPTSAEGVAYQAEKQKKKDMLKVEDTHRDLVNEEAGYQQALAEQTRLSTVTLSATATDAEKAQHNRDLAEASKTLNAAVRTKDAKVKAIQEELKKKYAGEIAQLDENMKVIKTRAEKRHEGSLTAPEQAQMAIVNQARNYADSVRNRRAGTLSYIQGAARRKQLADRMENQHQS